MKISLFFSLLFLSVAVYAHEEKTLIFACTHECHLHKRPIYRYARKLGYKARIIKIRKPRTAEELKQFDGVLIPGGVDINPKYYIEAVESELQEKIRSLDHLVNYTKEGVWRDKLEYGLLKTYFSSPSILETLPVLGICRGMQMITVSQGIPLYVDIKTELQIPNRRFRWDRVTASPGSSLMSELFPNAFWAFQIHHQGLRLDYFNQHRERWPQLEVTALSNGGKIAEAIEFKDRPVFGVQFHPELDFGSERRKIFTWFVEKAIEHHEAR